MSEPKRMGRPRKAPERGYRRNFTFRMGDVQRAAVLERAIRNGRSMSEEVEAIIDAAHDEDRMRVIAREEALKAVADSKTVRFGQWDVLPSGQQLMVNGPLNSPFNQCQAPNEAMRQRYELNGKQ